MSKNEKDKKFARWLVKVLLKGYHLQKDREAGKKEFTPVEVLSPTVSGPKSAIYPTKEE